MYTNMKSRCNNPKCKSYPDYGVPIALVSLVDTERQWFKSAAGLDVTNAPRRVLLWARDFGRPDIDDLRRRAGRALL